MNAQEITDILRITLPAIVSAMAAILATWLTRRQDRTQFELELKEREKDRITTIKEKVADRIIDIHVRFYELLSELERSISSRIRELKPPTEIVDNEEIEVEYTDFPYVRSPKKPDSRHVREVFVDVDAYIIENEIWFEPSFAEQLDDLLSDLEGIINDDAIDLFETNKFKAESLAKPYGHILDKIPSLRNKVRASMGFDMLENLKRGI